MKIITFFICLLLSISSAYAGPGAHGPNGEHLDAPSGTHASTDGAPRIDTFTESFELVGRLHDSELSILIDRYDTNEPVLNGKLEVEFNGLKAPATFHADHGDYAVDDANFIKALGQPGKHSLIFTLTAGEESDLLEGTLEVGAAEEKHGNDSSFRIWIIGGVMLAIVMAIVVIFTRRRQSNPGK